MNKTKFLQRLDGALSGLTDDERRRQLDFYAEMIDDMVDDGLSEEEAVLRLGSVQNIAAKILGDAEPGQLKKKKKLGLGGKILIALGVIAVIVTVLAAVFCFRTERPHGDIDDIDELLQFADVTDPNLNTENWSHITDGRNLELTPFDVETNGLTDIDVYWEFGNVTVAETEDENIVVSLGGIRGDLLIYEFIAGSLCLRSTDGEDPGRNLELRILLPENKGSIGSINVCTSDGDVSIDCEELSKIRAVTASGKVNVSDAGEQLSELSLCTASGDIRAELDEDEGNADIRITSASGNVTVAIDEDAAFTMNYATVTGKVSVSFDPRFVPDIKVGQNGESIYAQYEHKGRGAGMHLNLVTSSGDIRIVED